MKKISKQDLKGLSKSFPVYGQEDMRNVVGGGEPSSVDEMAAYIENNRTGVSLTDADGNVHWYSAVTEEEFNNWEGPWLGGYVVGLTGYVLPEAEVMGPNYTHRIVEYSTSRTVTVSTFRGSLAQEFADGISDQIYMQSQGLTGTAAVVGYILKKHPATGIIFGAISILSAKEAKKLSDAIRNASYTGYVKMVQNTLNPGYGYYGHTAIEIYDANGSQLY